METHIARDSTEDSLLIIQFKNQFRILGFMNANFLIHNHKESAASLIELHNRRLCTQLTVKAPPSSHQIDHRQAIIVADSQRQLPGRMHGKRVNCLLVDFHGLEMHKWIGVVDRDRAVCVGGYEVAGEGGEGGRGEEGEGSNCGGVMKRANLGGGGEVVDSDCLVIAAGDGCGSCDGDGFDGGEVGGEGEERSEREGIVVLTVFQPVAPNKALI